MKTALVLIDIQNDYFKGGTNELVGQETAAKKAAKILALFRRKNLPVFHVQHIATSAGATFFLPKHAWRADLRASRPTTARTRHR